MHSYENRGMRICKRHYPLAFQLRVRRTVKRTFSTVRASPAYFIRTLRRHAG